MTEVGLLAIGFVVAFVAGLLVSIRHDIRRELDGTGPVMEGWERVRPFTYRRKR